MLVPSAALFLVTLVSAQGTVAPDLHYGRLGHGLGVGGVVALDNGRVALASGTQIFGPPDYWLALEWDAAHGGYRTLHTSPLGNQPPRLLRQARAASGNDSLAIYREGGRLTFLAPDDFRRLAFLDLPADVEDLRFADLDQSAGDEIIIKRPQSIEVYGLDGQLRAQWNGIQGRVLQVAQMDDDPTLEIASDSGQVVDVATGTVQRDFSQVFGSNFLAADVDGDGRAELLTCPSGELRAWNVEDGSVEWSLNTIYSNGRLCVADLDDDGALELAFGSVKLLVYELDTLSLSWSLYPADGGYSALWTGDPDQDGRTELLATGGYDHTGADHLILYDTVAQQREWQSVHLDGPFLGPRLGDLDGDGQEELVVASTMSDSGYDNGRVVILDPADLSEKAISDPFGGFPGRGANGIGDVQLADLDGDGRDEIVLAGQSMTYGATVRCLRWDPAQGFTVVWDSTVIDGMKYHSLAIGDADGDGTLEVFAGAGAVHSGGESPSIRCFDGLDGRELWKSDAMGGFWQSVPRLAFAAAGQLPAQRVAHLAVVRADAQAVLLDALTGHQLAQLAGPYVDVEVAGGHQRRGFLLGARSGDLSLWQDGVLLPVGSLPTGSLQGFARPTPWSLSYGSNGQGALYDRGTGHRRWQTRDFGGSPGDECAFSSRQGVFYGCGEFGVYGFRLR